MKINDAEKAAAQAGASLPGTIFMSLLRDRVRAAAEQMLEEEVNALCGASYRPEEGAQYRRAGSENGTYYADGRRERIVRPRVRRQVGSGKECEHVLASYAAMRDPANNAAAVVTALQAGMSTRSQAWASDGVMSKSAASRHWVEASAAKIAEVRERNLRENSFFGLMMDGVVVSRGAMVVVALGLTCAGEKVVLDFEVGASENTAVCTALVLRLQSRGFAPADGHRLFAVLDGSAPLEAAVLAVWPKACIQRCLVHKERNLYGYLPKRHHAEAARLWECLREAEGKENGQAALAALRGFLSPLNYAATACLDEAGEKLITLHLLNAPIALHKALLSTNSIENVMRNYRRHTEKVSRWRLETDQVARWTAAALVYLERGFNRITGHAALPHLLAALAHDPNDTAIGPAPAASSSLLSSAPAKTLPLVLSALSA